jgi:dephospho-CoA kinase
MLTVGITGGIGSGKTTVCKIFETLQVPIYYADERAKWLLNNDEKIINSVKNLLGVEAYINGQLNRTYIADKVFNNKELLDSYNEIVHPAVAYDTLEWMQQYVYSKYVIKEAALLVETGLYLTLDKLIVVTAPTELRIQRVMQRDHTTRDAVEARINNQLSEEEKIKVADFVVINDGSTSLIDQVLKIHAILEYQF